MKTTGLVFLAVLAMVFASAGPAWAVKNTGTTITYSGQGSNADLVCGTVNGAPLEGPYLLWVFTATGAMGATITGPFGTDVAMIPASNGTFKYVSPYYDPATLLAVVASTFQGSANNPQLVISELCTCDNVATDPNNCGACGNACAYGSTCVLGVCTYWPIPKCFSRNCLLFPHLRLKKSI